MRKLLKSEGWARLREYAEAQIQTRRDDIELKPLEAMDQVLAEQFTKGEIAGIRHFVMMPENVVESLEAELEQLINREEGREDE